MPYKDKEKQRASQSRYYIKTKERDKEKRAKRSYDWQAKNRDKINAKVRNRRRMDPTYRNKKVEDSRVWREAHPEQMAKLKRKSRLKRLYGLTIEQYQEMLKTGNNGCYICKKIPQNTSAWDTLCVDHNHNTGKNRGLLCHSCNRAIGLMGDDISRFKKIILYLKRFNET